MRRRGEIPSTDRPEFTEQEPTRQRLVSNALIHAFFNRFNLESIRNDAATEGDDPVGSKEIGHVVPRPGFAIAIP